MPKLAIAMLLAGAFVAGSLPSAAEADSRQRTVMRAKVVLHAARAPAAAPKRKAAPGRCGTFFYFRAGRCVDARVTPARAR
jgi:hypothetical protein